MIKPQTDLYVCYGDSLKSQKGPRAVFIPKSIIYADKVAEAGTYTTISRL